MKNQELPSAELWLREAKSDKNAPMCGIYLLHNGVVRASAKAAVRFGEENTKPVTAMLFSYDEKKLDASVCRARSAKGIEYVRVWLNEGRLSVGDDLMYVLVGGDTRTNASEALKNLLEEIKTVCVTETEIYD